ncbi:MULTISPECIES: hypothetical protein [unclassified Pseudoalteromonas]|uniref:hypothetical protein n=1 Tax=unclassified Pseudoalteromonas TaxID=194690 RepID=UPI0025B35258|nr:MULTISPECIES: hypothetical protein [unclassified Pseudoalteromonas]MDN3377705.1 hypothetical protein [Pseudoalteromonas sp. APC 3893]MDN3385901.1 hypothetical protein [Pseudoalteromonas sp. APC 4017]
MATKIIKFTPIAASVALTLGLTGCGSDNDNNKYVKPDPVTVYNAEVSTSFNTQVSGKAVKGALQSAQVSVMTLNDAGEEVPVAFRLEAAEESFTAESTTSQADADASAQAKILESNPESTMTALNGVYSIFIEDGFTGPLTITVTAAKEGDESYVKCDSFVGCGDYTETPAASEEAGIVNNGDMSIDFGEWYKDDLTLQVVKYIKAPETAVSNVRSANFAEGDASVNSYSANVTLYTSIAAKMLLDSAKEGTAVSDDTIAAASLKTLVQVLGPDTAIKASALLADISLGGAVDFTDISEGDALDAGTLALVQTAVSLQSLAGTGENGSLSDVIANLSTAVQEGKVANNDNDAIKQIAAELQKAVENTSLIFAAVITGEGIDEAFAKVAENMGITDPEAIAKLKENATKAVEDVKAKATEAGVGEDLIETAKEVKDALEKIGCEDNCDVGEDFDAEVAAQVNEQLTAVQSFIDQVAPQVEVAETELNTVVELGDVGLETSDQVLAFNDAVFTLSTNLPKYNDWQLAIQTALTKASGLVKTAQILADNNTIYDQTLTTAQTVEADLTSGLAEVVAIIAGVEAQVIRASDAVTELGLELDVAIANATAATTSIETTQSAANTSATELDTAMIAVDAAMLTNSETATSAVEVANTAIAAAQSLALDAEQLELAAVAGSSAASALAGLAQEEADKNLATELAASATSAMTSSTELVSQAATALSTAQTLLNDATMAIAKFEFLTQVKADTATISDVSLVTKTGGKAAFDVGEMVYDVLDEAYDLGDEATDVVSTRYPQWTYSFNKTNQGEQRLFLSLSHEDGDQFVELKGEYIYDSSKTEAPARLALAYNGYLAVDVLDENDEVTHTVMASLGNSNDDLSIVASACLAGNAEQGDTCTIFDFSGDVSFDDIFNSSLVGVESQNEVTFTDGDVGFVGTVTASGDDITEMGNITATGVTGDLDFTAMVWLDDSVEDEAYGVEVKLHNEISYSISMFATDSNDEFTGSVNATYNDMMMQFGTVTEITNGISVEYIDGEVIDYTDITFLDESK